MDILDLLNGIEKPAKSKDLESDEIRLYLLLLASCSGP
jgi:hypothetical protein